MSTPDEDTRISELEDHAKRTRGLLKFARRAFVLEFAGTPKSGKSTSVEAVRHFFSRNGFRVHVLAERAAMCPIPMKGHLFFNTWCMASMLAELLANFETETDLIIIDRGLVDSLVWLIMQRNRGELTADESARFESFVLLDRWTSLIDLALVMYVDPQEALRRERENRIATADGSIMNPGTLATISTSVDEAVDRYRREFKNIVKWQSDGGVRPFNIKITASIIDYIDAFLDPNILVVQKQKLIDYGILAGGSFSDTDLERLKRFIGNNSVFLKRSLVEDNNEYVQIIACVVITHASKVFIFERQEKDEKSALYGKSTLWQGSHVQERIGQTAFQCVLDAGRQRINESLFLGRNFLLDPVGYCWRRDESHFGVILRLNIENTLTATDLMKKEYRRSRGFGLSGKLVEFAELKAKSADYNFEPWSLEMIGDYEQLLVRRKEA